MIVTYAPDGGDKRTWDYKSADLPSSEAEDIEEAVGVTFDEWQQKLLMGGMKARRALLWILRRRDEPGLKFADVAFTVREFTLDFDAGEKADVRREVQKSTQLSDDEKRQVFALLDDDEQGGETGGKGPSTLAGPTAGVG